MSKNYFQSDSKRTKNRNRKMDKMETNERYRREYSPFRPPPNTTIIHIHHRTSMVVVNDLLTKATTTQAFILDTESVKGEKHDHGALMQIQFFNMNDNPLVLLIETYHLPSRTTPLFDRIKQLSEIMLNTNKTIICWGPYEEEIKNFLHLKLFKSGKFGRIIDLQSYFRRWSNGDKTHPFKESRESTAERGANEINWSLQEATISALELFVDKKQTINEWHCGLDETLETWRTCRFSKKGYDGQLEKKTRREMIQYARNDCLVLDKLFHHMYSAEPIINNEIDLHPTTTTTIPRRKSSKKTKSTTSAIQYVDDDDDLSNISSDEERIIQVLSSKTKEQPHRVRYEQIELTVQITNEEREEFRSKEHESTIEQEHESTIRQEQEHESTIRQEHESKPPEQTRRIQSKAEQQRRKNKKFKEKKRTRPNFQNFIRRPIYGRYDYLKIRSQLVDDDIYTSHQILIDKRRLEVKIGFTSKQQLERARTIIRPNYFSKNQYTKRWC